MLFVSSSMYNVLTASVNLLHGFKVMYESILFCRCFGLLILSLSMFFIAFMICLWLCKVSACGGCIFGIYSGFGILQHMFFVMSPWFVVFSCVASS